MSAPQPGLPDPVGDSQRIFRAALAAMSHPGRVECVDTPTDTPPFSRAAVALMLTLADETTPVWLDAAHAPGADHLQFHCGAPVVNAPAEADFAVAAGGACPLPDQWACGSALEPHRSATLILEVEALGTGERYRLSGPGIAGTRLFACRGLPRAWLAARATNAFPCGVDIFLTSGDLIAALPRTTQIEA